MLSFVKSEVDGLVVMLSFTGDPTVQRAGGAHMHMQAHTTYAHGHAHAHAMMSCAGVLWIGKSYFNSVGVEP